MDTLFAQREQKKVRVENAKKLSKSFPKCTKKTFDNLVTSDEYVRVVTRLGEAKCSNHFIIHFLTK